MKRKILFALAASLFTVALSGIALADTVTFTITNPNQTTARGATLSYTATVFAPSTNTGNEYLNGLAFTVSPANTFTINTDPFLNNFPFFLTPGQSYTNLLFTLLVPPTSTISPFIGSVSLLGGATGSSNGTLGTAAFTTTVTPEPSSLLLLGSGLLSGVGLYRRNRKGLAGSAEAVS